MFTNQGLNIESTILLVSIIAIIVIVIIMRYSRLPQLVKGLISKVNKSNNDQLDINALFQSINKAGYSYDRYQDIFYSNRYPWQRKYGYCRLYDEASAPYNSFIGKMNAIYQQAPELFDIILKVGKSNDIFEKYKDIKDYLE